MQLTCFILANWTFWGLRFEVQMSNLYTNWMHLVNAKDVTILCNKLDF